MPKVEEEVEESDSIKSSDEEDRPDLDAFQQEKLEKLQTQIMEA